MKNPRGKYVVCGLALLAATSIVFAVVALKEPIFESWYLWGLGSEDVEERESAARSLGQMQSTRAIPTLIEILKRECVSPEEPTTAGELPILHYSAQALASIGSPAVSSLIGTFQYEVDHTKLEDPDDDFRVTAMYALARIGEPAVEPLVNALQNDNANVRAFSASALSLLGARAKSALPVLERSLQDKSEQVRREATSAVKEIERLTKGH